MDGRCARLLIIVPLLELTLAPSPLQVDWQGNGRPSQYPEGWYWFGVAIGWAPGASWSCSSTWTPSSHQVTVIISSQVSWWLPPASWKLPSHVNCPAHWTSRGWIDRRIPSASWQCDGSGEDGYECVPVLVPLFVLGVTLTPSLVQP